MRWPFEDNEYVWKKRYNPERIVGFTICCGDLPIRYYRFDGKSLTGYNRINISRDGGMGFPGDFFSEKRIELTAGQSADIRAMLSLIPFGELKSEAHIIELRESMAEGFAVNRMLACTMEDGKIFRYLPGEEIHPSVMMLFHSLSLICPLPEYAPVVQEETGKGESSVRMLVVCPECGKKTISPAKHCGMCGTNIERRENLRIAGPYSEQDTMLGCRACGEWFPGNYRYCINCGAALKFR